PEELEVNLCNSGVMAFDGRHLVGLLDRLDTNNAKNEYYLTETVALARADGYAAAVVEGAEEELLGVNSRADLAIAEAVVQDALRAQALEGGATLIDPGTVWFHHDTELGRDVIVEPNVVFGPGVRVADGARIRAFSHLEGAVVAAEAVVGPYARLRPGAHIGAGARVGNFVEIKNADLGAGAKANHLSYIGDAHVGAGANIGAGTITCNYDGFGKYETNIGAGAFIGSNSALVAPVTIGDGAIVAAGSTISHDVAGDALAIERAEQVTKTGWAARFRKLKSKG
ncbi:MAG: DapH/DapD/GlmU-related protein, partial [Rhodospirillaceae bacterium]